MTAPLSRFPLVQLRHISAVPITNGLGEAGDPANDAAWPRYIRTTDIVAVRALDQNKRVTLSPEIADQARVLRGDILMTSAGATVGKSYLHLTDETACFAGYLSRLRVRSDRALPEFVAYWTESSHYTDQVQSGAVKSTIENFSAAKYRAMRMPVPPLQEQRAIADYLDGETAQIDAFIAKNEELITLLTERRAATITYALTSGLDDSAGGQDGARIGAIPARWEVMPLRYLLQRIEQGVSPQAESGLAVGDNQFGVLKAGCVNGGVYRPTEHKLLPAGFDFDRSLLVRPGDLLVNRASGSVQLLGSAAIATESVYRLILSDKTFRIVPSARTSRNYLYWLLNSQMYREQVEASVSGADGLANNLSQSNLRRFMVPVPPQKEQEQISFHLKDRCAKIDRSIATARRSVSLAQERRAALISAAVTGQINVRAVA